METQAINDDFHLVLLAEKCLFFQHSAVSSETPACLVFLVHAPLYLTAQFLIISHRVKP